MPHVVANFLISLETAFLADLYFLNIDFVYTQVISIFSRTEEVDGERQKKAVWNKTNTAKKEGDSEVPT